MLGRLHPLSLYGECWVDSYRFAIMRMFDRLHGLSRFSSELLRPEGSPEQPRVHTCEIRGKCKTLSWGLLTLFEGGTWDRCSYYQRTDWQLSPCTRRHDLKDRHTHTHTHRQQSRCMTAPNCNMTLSPFVACIVVRNDVMR